DVTRFGQTSDDVLTCDWITHGNHHWRTGIMAGGILTCLDCKVLNYLALSKSGIYYKAQFTPPDTIFPHHPSDLAPVSTGTKDPENAGALTNRLVNWKQRTRHTDL